MNKESERNAGASQAAKSDRRRFLSSTSSMAMLGGLAAGYGTFFYLAGRFVYPAHGTVVAWQYVGRVDELQAGESFDYMSPAGERVVVARRDGQRDGFVALSSVCPHLGCQVHWVSSRGEFFCPCHNGVFDRQGKAISGPPAAAGQSLKRYPLKVEGGLLLIEIPLETVSGNNGQLARATLPSNDASKRVGPQDRGAEEA